LQLKTKYLTTPGSQRLQRSFQMLQPFAVSSLLKRVWARSGQRKIVHRDLGILAPPDRFPPRGQDLEPGDFERQGQQILDTVKRRVFLVQDQKNLLGDILCLSGRAFPS